MTRIDELSSDLVVYAARLVRDMRRTHDLTAGHRVLSLLDEYGALGVSALAALDRCSQPTMSGAVAQLRERSWVSTRTNPADARGNLVELTPDGRTELARIRALNARVVADRVTDHPTRTEEDLATAVAVLRALLEPPEGATP